MKVLLKYFSISLISLGMMLPIISQGKEPVYVVRSTKSGADDPEFKKLLGEAKEAQKKANSVGGEWRDVGKFLKEAEQAAESGDLDKAKKLANKAKTQCEIGYEQAVSQKGKVEHPSYLK